MIFRKALFAVAVLFTSCVLVPVAYADTQELVLSEQNSYGFSPSSLIDITDQASSLLLSYYEKPITVDYKADDSPVTQGDLAVNSFLTTELKKITPDIPVISEESTLNEEVKGPFWLIDPMDGTKSFIRRTGQFTVNAALINDGKPVLGIIQIPVSGVVYIAAQGSAYKKDGFDAGFKSISVRKANPEELTLVASHLHRSDDDEAFISKYKIKHFKEMSSSIKFCLVAEGSVDIYPRLGTTMEWDTAAGQAILVAAGGHVVFKGDGKEFTYGKSEYTNPHFVAYGDIPHFSVP